MERFWRLSTLLCCIIVKVDWGPDPVKLQKYKSIIKVVYTSLSLYQKSLESIQLRCMRNRQRQNYWAVTIQRHWMEKISLDILLKDLKDKRVNKWSQNVHFWATYSFNVLLNVSLFHSSFLLLHKNDS